MVQPPRPRWRRPLLARGFAAAWAPAMAPAVAGSRLCGCLERLLRRQRGPRYGRHAVRQRDGLLAGRLGPRGGRRSKGARGRRTTAYQALQPPRRPVHPGRPRRRVCWRYFVLLWLVALVRGCLVPASGTVEAPRWHSGSRARIRPRAARGRSTQQRLRPGAPGQGQGGFPTVMGKVADPAAHKSMLLRSLPSAAWRSLPSLHVLPGRPHLTDSAWVFGLVRCVAPLRAEPSPAAAWRRWPRPLPRWPRAMCGQGGHRRQGDDRGSQGHRRVRGHRLRLGKAVDKAAAPPQPGSDPANQSAPRVPWANLRPGLLRGARSATRRASESCGLPLSRTAARQWFSRGRRRPALLASGRRGRPPRHGAYLHGRHYGLAALPAFSASRKRCLERKLFCARAWSPPTRPPSRL